MLIFVLGFLFMGLFTSGKSSINIKIKKKLIDPNVFTIEKKLEKLKEKLNNNNPQQQKPKQGIKNLKDNLLNLKIEELNLVKLEEIGNRLNNLLKDLCERNKEKSVERNLQDNICDIQYEIVKEVKKKNLEEEEGDEEGEEEEDEK
mgnify:FL=1